MCHKICPNPSHDCIKCYYLDLKKAIEEEKQ